MSTLDIHRRALIREQGHAADRRKEAARLSERIVQKQRELARAKSPNQIKSITNEMLRLTDKRSDVERNAARYESKAADLVKKIQAGELAEQKKHAKLQENERKKQQRDLERITRSVRSTTMQMGDIQDRLESVEAQFLDQVREAVAADSGDHEYDVFLSHTGDDKDDATILCAELLKCDLKVWFDGAKLKLGRSLTNQIDAGLANSRAGVILITDAYLKGRTWTKREAGALIGADRRVIPVLHGVDREELVNYSPLLADLFGLNTKYEDFEEIAAKIAETLREDPEEADE